MKRSRVVMMWYRLMAWYWAGQAKRALVFLGKAMDGAGYGRKQKRAIGHYLLKDKMGKLPWLIGGR